MFQLFHTYLLRETILFFYILICGFSIILCDVRILGVYCFVSWFSYSIRKCIRSSGFFLIFCVLGMIVLLILHTLLLQSLFYMHFCICTVQMIGKLSPNRDRCVSFFLLLLSSYFYRICNYGRWAIMLMIFNGWVHHGQAFSG